MEIVQLDELNDETDQHEGANDLGLIVVHWTASRMRAALARPFSCFFTLSR